MASRRTLGDAWVTINADGSRLRAQIKAAGEAAIKGLSIDIRLNANDKDMAAEARAAAARAQKAAGTVHVPMHLDSTGVQRAAADILAQQARISRARNQDTVAAARQRDATTRMYRSMFDQIAKGEAAVQRSEQARIKQEKAIKDAQDKAWASYGKNLLASEKMDSRAAALREANQAKIAAAQDKAWASYGKNLLAAEAIDKQVVTDSTFRWRGWVNTILDVARKDIPLFGGAFQGVLPHVLAVTNGLHLAADAAVEILATWVPAALAVTIFGAAAAKSALQVERNVKNMGIATQATGQQFAVMGKIGSGALSELAKPYVFQLFGLGLIAMQKNSNQTSAVVQQMGRTVTKWAAEATSAYLGSTGKMALVGSRDFKLIGDSFHALGSAFNVVLKSVPGYAETLLRFGATALQAFAVVVKALQPVITGFLAFHGAFLYLGTAVTVLKFGLGQLIKPFNQVKNLLADSSNAADKGVSAWKRTTTAVREAGQEMQGSFTKGARSVKAALNDLPQGASSTTRAFTALKAGGSAALSGIGSAAVKAGSALKNGFLRVMDNLGINPWVAGLAAVGFGVGLLVQHFILAKDAAQQFGAAADQAISNSTVRNFGDIITTQLSAAKAAYAASAVAAANYAKQLNVNHVAASYQVRDAANVANGQAGAAVHLQKLTQLQQNYGLVISDLQGKQDRFNQHLGTLGRSLGGTSAAMELVERSGVSMDDFVSKDTKTWLQAQLQVEATAKGYQAMTAGVGSLGTALNALNIQDSQQLKSATDLEGAYTNFITVLTGGITNLGTFSQGMATLEQNLGIAGAQFRNLSLGKLKGQLAVSKVSLDGVSTASMTAAQAFAQQVQNGTALYNSLLSLSTVSGNSAKSQHQLAAAGKDIVAQLLPLAANSKTARSEVFALAQIVGYTGNNSLKGLRAWLGRTSGSMADLHKQTNLLTQGASNLAQDAKTLASNLSSNLNAAMAQSIIYAYGGQRAINAAARAVVTFQRDSSPENYRKMTASLKPVADMMLQVSGNTALAKNQFIVWASRLGIGRAEAGKMFDALEHLNKGAKDTTGQAGITNRSFNAMAAQFRISRDQANQLWLKLAHNNLDFVGGRAKASHDAFVKWAAQLGISKNAANALWDKIAHQNLDNWLTHKVGVSMAAFAKWTNQVGLTKAQTNELWRKIGEQKFDFLRGKSEANRASFEKLARQYGITTGQADSLWRMLQHQQLDSVGRKALTSASAMNTLANGIANGTVAMQDLGTVWQGMQKVLGGPPVTVKTTLPGHQSFKLSQGGVNSPHASGGAIPGFAPGSDTVPARLSPGEFVVNPTAARAFGYKNLEAINSIRPGANQRQVRDQYQAFVNGGQVASYETGWAGHVYRWGGGANPTTGWDCSSFQNFVLGHFGFNDPNGGRAPSAAHGAVASDYNKFPHVAWNQGQIGDFAVENSGGHVGILVANASGNGPIRGFAAIGHAFGTNYQTFDPGSFHLVKGPWNPGGTLIPGAGGAGSTALSPFTPAQDKQIKAALSETALLEHALTVSGNGLGAPMAGAVAKSVDGAATNIHNKIQTEYNAKLAAAAAAGLAGIGGNGSGPLGGATGSSMANGQELYTYLLNNLFGGNKIAAAGATASIWGESNWNPFAVGTGGRGLIGWTPPSKISDATFRGGMRTQLPAIIQFVNQNGDQGVIAQMERARSVTDAAWLWGRGVERFGIPDVHSTGIALATSIMNGSSTPASGGRSAIGHSSGSGPGGGHHLAAGGQVPGFAPGSDTVPAMLSPGEFVVNPTAAKAFGYENLHALNAQKFAKGGVVTPLQRFEQSVAAMTSSGRLAKLKSLISLANTEHNNLAHFKAGSAPWNSLEHQISLHKQEIAFLESKGTHLPAPPRPTAAKAKPKVFPPGPVGAFERKIDEIGTRIKSVQAKLAKDQAAFNATAFVADENRIGALTDAQTAERKALAAYQAAHAHTTPAQRKAAAAKARTAAKTRAFNAAVARLHTISGLRTPQQKAAYWSSPLLGRLADDLMHHSVHPYSLPGASSSAISGLALGASPDLLNAIYGGDWHAIASLLSRGDQRQFSVFKGLANGRGKRMALGGTIGERVLGIGMTTGSNYSFGESGREVVTPANKLAGNPNARLEALLTENNKLVAENTRAVRAADQNNQKGLGGAGRGIR